MERRRRHRVTQVVFAALLAAAACIRIASYNETEYQYATSLKAEALALMDKATEPYAQHQADAEKLTLDLSKAYEYAAGRPNNEISAKQWQILRDTSRNLLGSFLARWKAEKTLGSTYLADKKQQVSDAFDTISSLESGKAKPKGAN